jgi:NTE family protein
VLGQTFRAIIHSRMKTGMEKYRQQYPDADILLFEPDREDADMFFANIFSYWQRKRLCGLAFAKTRQSLLARASHLKPLLKQHGITLRVDKLNDKTRHINAAVNDARPLHPDIKGNNVGRAKRELRHTLETLERALAATR